MTYQTLSVLLGVLFVAELFVAAGFYLLQFGPLSSFTVEAASARASFIKEKAEQAKEDSETIRQLRDQTQRTAEDISTVLENLRRAEKEIETLKDHLKKLAHQLGTLMVRSVEIAYLEYAGRGMFPSPYADRIIAGINDLLAIAIPDPSQRAQFVQQLQRYVQEATVREEKAGESG